MSIGNSIRNRIYVIIPNLAAGDIVIRNDILLTGIEGDPATTLLELEGLVIAADIVNCDGEARDGNRKGKSG